MTNTLADLIEDRFGLATATGREMPAEGTSAAMLAHRTHRRYTPDPVADELLDMVLACALSSPSKSDLQQLSIIRVIDPHKRRAIAELIPDMPWIGTAPVFMVFCGDNRRIRRICALRGRPFGNDHLDSFLNAAVDAGMALQSTITAAAAVGLGCCPISVVRNHIDAIGAILSLPDCVFPVAGLTVGYPAQTGYVSLRLPPAVTVHVDGYDDDALAAEIDGYDRRRDQRFSIPRDNQRHTETFGQAEFYGWSEDKARQVSTPERAGLGAYLRRHGFDLS